MGGNKEKSLDLLIETYKLYAAFCAIIIAGLLSFSSSLNKANSVQFLYVAIGALLLSSLFCIFGIQNFISRTYKKDFDIYSRGAKFVTISIMILLFVGLLFGFLFLVRQEKLKGEKINELNKIENAKSKVSNMGHHIDSIHNNTYKTK